MTRFYVCVVCVNWGRGYDPGEFKANVLRVMKFTRRWEHVVILPQELDEEPDPAKEHKEFGSMLEPGTKKVFWRSHEPIVLSRDFKVSRRRRVLTMGSGQEIDPDFENVGPRRYAVTCVSHYRGIDLGWGNTHPHRRGLNPKVEQARVKGEWVFSDELQGVRRSNGGISGFWGADMNDDWVPRLVTGESVAISRGLDHLRYWEHPNGATITILDKGSLNGTIDPHDPLWCRALIEERRAA